MLSSAVNYGERSRGERMDKFGADKAEILRLVRSKQEKFWKISDAIWSYAELGLEEFKSAKLLADTLEEAGFKVQRGAAGMPTAILATWSNGAGKPVIGYLGEYDALPMLSQKAGAITHDPVVPGGPGHGCGHNTMGTMQALTVITIKEFMQRKGLAGTLKFFGSPAEETLVSRPYMARANLFEGLDAVIDNHAGGDFSTSYGVSGNAMYSFVVSYAGKTAHAGGVPWLGRSATDAVELMHAGTERMREHVPPTARIHWVTTEGGEAPNVVPDRAATWYFVRDTDKNVEADFKWVMECAAAAAQMTQTSYTSKVLTAIHQRYSNRGLAELLFENMKAVGKPEYTREEVAWANSLQKSYGLPEKGLDYPIKLEKPTAEFRGGSSDVGEVTLLAPCATIRYPTRAAGEFPSHHWTVTTCGITSIAHKGITAGAQVGALTTYDLLTQPDVLAKIQKEFATATRKNPYKSYLPADAEPPLGFNAALMAKYLPEMTKHYLNP
jgi:aminobenzoyl-glutamate utilization protein B